MHRKHLGSSLALVIALGLGTGLGAAPASALQPPTAVSMSTVKLAKLTTANLNLRQTASTGSKILLTIPKNTAVTITKTSGSWSYTSYKGKSGWVTSSYLKNAPVTATYLYATKAATLRATASDKGKSLGAVPHRAKVQKLGTSGSFTKLKYGTKTGYLRTNGLSTKQPAAPKTYLYTSTTATLRATASDKGKSLGTLVRRTKVEKLGTSGTFTKLKTGSTTGFVKTSGLATTIPAKTYRWATANTQTRSSAKNTAKKKYVIKKGAQVEWLQTAGSWQLVTTAQGSAWAPGAALATKKPAPPAAKPTHRWTTANVNLRPTSSTQGTPLGTVPRGEKVTLVKSSSGWANAKTSKGTGWMSEDYLATTSVAPTPKPPAEKPPVKETYRWTTSDVNLRADGSTSKPSLGVIPKGEKLVYLKSAGGWANVKTSEGTGWIAESYLSTKEVVDTPPTAPPATDAKYRWATAAVNVRSSGSTAGAVLGVLATGEKVTYLKSAGGWANIKSAKWTGWVSESYLSSTVFTASAGLKPNAVKVKNLITMLFPYEVSSIGGVRKGSVGHSAGVALDLMIRNYKSPAGIKAGDKIAQYLLDNRQELGIDYLIWRDKIWLSHKGWVPYSGGGYGGHLGAWNDTTLHNDHIHVETLK